MPPARTVLPILLVALAFPYASAETERRHGLPAQAPDAPVVVRIDGIRNNRGLLRASLFRSAEGFPEDSARAAFTRSIAVSGASAEVRFDSIPPGTWAVAILHDENGNRRLDRFLRVPREGVGASNGAAQSGVPSFERAKFEHGRGRTDVIIRLQYWL